MGNEQTTDEQLAHCPSCNGPAIRKGKAIACQTCDASFRYTKEGPKLVELGPFDELAERVSALEGTAAQPEDIGEPEAPEEIPAQAAEEIKTDQAEDGI